MLPLAHIGFTVATVKILEQGLRMHQIDYRVVIAASLLPDIVDKPLASILVGSYSYESRAFGHSMIFIGCVALLLLIHWLWTRNNWLVPVVFGVVLHDLFDEMWTQAGVFYWPLLGWKFPKPTEFAWRELISLGDYKIHLLDFYDNVSMLILLYYFMRVALGGKLLEFVRQGRLEK